jgi:hypothetical protein
MTLFDRPDFLKNVLLLDSATGVASGVLATLGATALAAATGLPRGLLVSSGLSLFPIAAFMAYVATRATIPAAGVWLVIIGNLAWVAASLWLALAGGLGQNGWGSALLLVQAAAVALLAGLECIGVSRRQMAPIA